MTALIAIEWVYPDGITPLVAQTGKIRVEPMQGWVAGDALVNRRQTVHHVQGGTFILSLPNDTARVWKIHNDPVGVTAWTDYKLLPAGDPDTPTHHAYHDLVTVDPDTLNPAPEELVDVIAAVAAETVTTGAVVDGNLILATGTGHAINAGRVAGQDGQDGTDGVNGDDGDPGKSAYDIAVTQGYVGTETEWLNSLKADAPTITDNGTTVTIGA